MPQSAPKQSLLNQRSALGLGAGALSALLYLAIQLGSPGALIFAYLSPLPLYAVGLSLGWAVVMIAAIAASIIILLLGGGIDAMTYACLNAAPAVWLIRLALLSRPDQQGKPEWYPQGNLVMWLAMGAAGLFGFALMLAGVLGNGLWDGVALYMDAMVSNLASANGQEPAQPLRQLTASASTWLPAMVGVSWMTMQIVNGTLAQGLVTRFGRNLRPSTELATFQVPGSMVYALALAFAGSFLPGDIGLIARTLAIFAAYPFLFAGLAVVHALSRRLAARTIMLAVFYIVIIMLGWPVLLVTGIGLVDQWFDFRGRYGGPDQNAGNDIGIGPTGGSGGPGGNQEEK